MSFIVALWRLCRENERLLGFEWDSHGITHGDFGDIWGFHIHNGHIMRDTSDFITWLLDMMGYTLW